MNAVDQCRRRRFRPIGGRGRLLLSAVVLMGLAGCDSFGDKWSGDPFMGVHAPQSPAPMAAAPGNVPGQATAATDRIPPIPAAYAAVGAAAVAGGETAAPEDGRTLAITTDTVVPTSQPVGGAARGAAPGVTVGDPEPATNDSTSRLTPPAASPPTLQQLSASAPTGSPAITTFDQAQQFLKQRGVTWQRLEMEEGQWKFECGIPNRSNPSFNHHFVSKNSFADPLSAMRAIIAEIDKKAN